MTTQRRLLLYFLKLATAVVIIVYMFKKSYFDPAQIGATVFSPLFLIFVAFIGTSFALGAERLRFLLSLRGSLIPFLSCLKLTLIGTFFNFLIPGGIGGDITKGYYLFRRDQKKMKESASVVLFDRFVGLYTMAFFSCLSVHLISISDSEKLRRYPIVPLIDMIFLVLNFPHFYLLLPRRWRSTWKNLLRERLKPALSIFSEIELLYENKRRLLYPFFLTACAQILIVALYKIAIDQISPDSPRLEVLLFVVSVGSILTAVPITPASIGVGQAIFVFLFAVTGFIHPEEAATVVTINQLATMVVSLAGGYFYVFDNHSTRKTS